MNTMKAILCVSALMMLSSTGFATETQVFRSVDAQGNVVFTDTPSKNAKPVDIQAPSSVQAMPVAPRVDTPAAPPQDSSAFRGYQAMVITQPDNGVGLNNGAGDVDVSVSLVPPLRTDLGHGLTIMLDGKPVLQNSARMNVALSDVDRGEHTLEAFVVNPMGQVVFQSAPVKFSLQRTSLLLPGRAVQVPPSALPTPRAAP